MDDAQADFIIRTQKERNDAWACIEKLEEELQKEKAKWADLAELISKLEICRASAKNLIAAHDKLFTNPPTP